MNILLIGKYPPIEGGVSRNNYYFTQSLAAAGHTVHVVTNAFEVEQSHRIYMEDEDYKRLTPQYDKGKIHLWSTESLGHHEHYIPQGIPFVTKLTSLGTGVCEKYNIDIIISSYFEPYAVAGNMVSNWNDIPMITIHAGSDIGRLIKQDLLGRCYARILQQSTVVATNISRHDQLKRLGVSPFQIHPAPRSAIHKNVFNKNVETLDINQLLRNLKASFKDKPKYLLANFKEIDTTKKIFGIYGKLGESKGSYDILHALHKVKENGHDFYLVSITHGREAAEKDFLELATKLNLLDNIRNLPFLPNWKIPSYIKATDAMFFLERGFDIKSHSPIVPAEIFACEKCMILSREVYDNQYQFKDVMTEDENVLVVEPRETNELVKAIESVITNEELVKKLEANMTKSIKTLPTEKEEIDSLLEIIEFAQSKVQKRPS